MINIEPEHDKKARNACTAGEIAASTLEPQGEGPGCILDGNGGMVLCHDKGTARVRQACQARMLTGLSTWHVDNSVYNFGTDAASV